MAHPPLETAINRVLVILDSTSAELSVLPTAAELAAAMQAELHGLFIEDDSLLRLAGLPFAQEICSTSALVRPLSIEAIERRFRTLAEQIRASLEQSAEQAQITWSFQVARGTARSDPQDVSEGADLLVLGCRTAFAEPRRERTANLAQSLPVAAVYDGSAAAKRALIATSVLSLAKRQSPRILLATTTTSVISLHLEAAEILREHGTTQFSAHPTANLAQLLTVLRQHPSSLLLLPRNSEFLKAEPLRQLRDRRLPYLIGIVN